MLIIDKLCYSSGLRYVNASLKFLFAIITLLLCIISRSLMIAVITLVTTGIITVHYGKIPFKTYLKLMAGPAAFLLLSTIAIIFSYGDSPLSFAAIPVGEKYITINPQSFSFALQLIVTAFASISCLFFLSLSTPVTDILNVLKKFKCPKLIIELMLLIYRFIFILLDMANAFSNASNSRLGNVDFATSCRSMGALLSALLVRAFKRSGQLYDAMESRCYDGDILVLDEHHPVLAHHVIFFVVFETSLLIIYVFQ